MSNISRPSAKPTNAELARIINQLRLAINSVASTPSSSSVSADVGASDIQEIISDIYQIPPAPLTLTATGLFNHILLQITGSDYLGHFETEFWRNSVDDLGTAVLIASTPSAMWDDQPPDSSLSTTYYYWARFKNLNIPPQFGPFNATAGTEAHTADDPAYMLEVLSGEIRDTQLYSDLSTRIDLIDTPTSGLVDKVTDLQTQINDFSGDLGTDVYIQATEPVAGSGGVPTPIPDNARWYDSDDNNHPYLWNGTNWLDLRDPRIGVNATDIDTLEATVNNATTGVAATATALDTVETLVNNTSNGNVALASKISSLESTVDDPTDGVTATATALDAVETLVNHSTNGNVALASRASSLESTVNDATDGVVANASAIDTVETVVNDGTSGNSALSSRTSTLETTVNDPITGVGATASAIDAVETIVNDANSGNAALSSKTTALETTVNDPASGVSATSTAVTGLETRIGDNEDGIYAQGQLITGIQTDIGNNHADIVSETLARSTEDGALGERIDAIVLHADDGWTAAIGDEETARINADAALTIRINTNKATADDNEAAIISEATTRANEDEAIGERIDSVSAVALDNYSLILNEQITRASEDETLSTSIDTHYSSATNYADNVAGDAETAAKDYTDVNFVTKTLYDTDIADIQSQLDGQIVSWFYDGVPDLTNDPASAWTTTALRDEHLGDLYYDLDSGASYRFVIDAGVYSWSAIPDTGVAAAMAAASAAQDTADSKRRVFVTTPTSPYDIGDLWANGATIYRANAARTSGYVASEWTKIGDVTDYATIEAANQAYADAQANAAIVTANAYADGEITDSETAMIDSANAYADARKTEALAYADGVATEAETAAINAANDYADAAADLAETTAKAWADGIVDAEEARAIADAQAKADAAQAAATSHADAIVQTETTTRITADDVLAQDITDLQTDVGGNTAAVETEATARVDGDGLAYAEYTIKTAVRGSDGKLVWAGIGVGVEDGASGSPISEILLSADVIAIVPPDMDSSLDPVLPFVYDSETGAIIINVALIKEATITSAMIESLAADKITAGTITAFLTIVGSMLRSSDSLVSLDMVNKILKMTDSAGDYVEMTPAELKFVYDGAEYKSVKRIEIGSASSGDTVTFSPPFKTIPSVMCSLRDITTWDMSVNSAYDQSIEILVYDITESSFKVKANQVLEGGNDYSDSDNHDLDPTHTEYKSDPDMVRCRVHCCNWESCGWDGSHETECSSDYASGYVRVSIRTNSAMRQGDQYDDWVSMWYGPVGDGKYIYIEMPYANRWDVKAEAYGTNVSCSGDGCSYSGNKEWFGFTWDTEGQTIQATGEMNWLAIEGGD